MTFQNGPSHQATQDSEEPEVDECGKPKVLVIDDDISIIKLVVATLQDEFDVMFAKDSLKAIQLLESPQTFDLILLDVNLPEIGGFELCKILKGMAGRADTPVIFITSRSSIEDKTRGFELGAVDFVTKPIEYPILKARVRTHVTLKQQKEQLKALSLTDPLTNLPNKRAYQEIFGKEFNKAKNNDSLLALVVMDVDHFKAYNDNYGHEQGDECLTRLAKIVQRSLLHSSETAFRYGGEEFVVIAPGADELITRNVAQRILDNLQEEALPHAWSSCAGHVTVSMGAFVGHVADFNKISEVFEIADQKLYLAKQNGRAQLIL